MGSRSRLSYLVTLWQERAYGTDIPLHANRAPADRRGGFFLSQHAKTAFNPRFFAELRG
jgi:hypothetical protein